MTSQTFQFCSDFHLGHCCKISHQLHLCSQKTYHTGLDWIINMLSQKLGQIIGKNNDFPAKLVLIENFISNENSPEHYSPPASDAGKAVPIFRASPLEQGGHDPGAKGEHPNMHPGVPSFHLRKDIEKNTFHRNATNTW